MRKKAAPCVYMDIRNYIYKSVSKVGAAARRGGFNAREHFTLNMRNEKKKKNGKIFIEIELLCVRRRRMWLYVYVCVCGERVREVCCNKHTFLLPFKYTIQRARELFKHKPENVFSLLIYIFCSRCCLKSKRFCFIWLKISKLAIENELVTLGLRTIKRNVK